jgi:hypothetical protein
MGFPKKRNTQYVVYVMRARDMVVAHPDTDYTHLCATCGQPVGIYPSTVRLMRKRRNVKLICNHCAPEPIGSVPPVPGALGEIGQSSKVR